MTREADIRNAIARALDDVSGDRTALDLVEEIPMVEAAVEHIVVERIESARGQGLSWEAIAQRLGTSRQAAHKRFGRKAKRQRGPRIEIKLERSKKES